MSISREQLDLLLIHLLRSETVCRQAVGKLLALDLKKNHRDIHALIWSIASFWYKTHNQLIGDLQLQSEINRSIAEQPHLLLPEEADQLTRLGKLIYTFPEQYLCIPNIIEVLQNYLDELKILPLMQMSQQLDGNVNDLLNKMNQAYSNSRVTSVETTGMGTPELGFKFTPLQPTKVDFLDELLGGGTSTTGEVIGLFGPSGGGKTLLGLQTVGSIGMSKRHAIYFSYEQPVWPDLGIRLYSFLSHTDRRSLANKSWEQIPEHLQAKVKAVCEETRPYLHFIDMHDGKISGNGGMQELEGILYRETDIYQPQLIVVDWLGVVVDRYISSHDMDSRDAMRVARQFIDQLVALASKFKTTVLVLHQLSTEACKNKPRQKPSWTDAAEYKSITWLMSYSLALGTRDVNSNVCWLSATKARNSPISDALIQMQGEFNRFVDVTSTYEVSPDPRSPAQFVLKENNISTTDGLPFDE